MALTAPLLKEDPDKQRQLDRMKRRATALLAASAAIFGVALSFESAYPWLGYIRATAEAAIVGGLADWFAVTALFRHPLGIPIPHTATCPWTLVGSAALNEVGGLEKNHHPESSR